MIKHYVKNKFKKTFKYKKNIIIISAIICFFIYIFFNPFLISKKILNSEIILGYQFWQYSIQSNYDKEETILWAEKEILKEKNNKQVLNIFNKLKKDQNITITKNKETGKIYFFTNEGGYKSYLEIYRPQGTELELEEKIWILHPYKVGYGEYDEENNELYLGVIRTCFNEGCFLEDWIDGSSSVNINFWRKINSLVNKEI